MTKEVMYGNIYKISVVEERLEKIEEQILKYEVDDSLVTELGEIAIQVNELLQYRISWYDQQILNNLLKRINYLRALYLKTVLDVRAGKLSAELKELVTDKAWRVFLRLDEVRGMELDLVSKHQLHQDYYLDILSAQHELKARIQEIGLKTY